MISVSSAIFFLSLNSKSAHSPALMISATVFRSIEFTKTCRII